MGHFGGWLLLWFAFTPLAIWLIVKRGAISWWMGILLFLVGVLPAPFLTIAVLHWTGGN